MDNQTPTLIPSRIIVLFGPSGVGKTTVSERLALSLIAYGEFRVALLDGDVVRSMLRPTLSYTPPDRASQALRLAHMTVAMCHVDDIVIVSAILPLRESRKRFMEICNEGGHHVLFIELFAPVDVLRRRDTKRLYEVHADQPYESEGDERYIYDTSLASPTAITEDIRARYVLRGPKR